MPRKPKPLEPLDVVVIDILVARQQTVGVSQRQLAREAGMSLNRVGIIFRKEGPAPTVGELDLIGRVLGLKASTVVREAERQIGGAAVLDARKRAKLRTGDVGRSVPDASTQAARKVSSRPEHDATRQWDDVGEEPQVSDGESPQPRS